MDVEILGWMLEMWTAGSQMDWCPVIPGLSAHLAGGAMTCLESVPNQHVLLPEGYHYILSCAASVKK